MKGPEHFAEAERLLDEPRSAYPDAIAWAVVQAQAQVHATLALVAATIDTAEGTPNFEAWQRVTR